MAIISSIHLFLLGRPGDRQPVVDGKRVLVCLGAIWVISLSGLAKAEFSGSKQVPAGPGYPEYRLIQARECSQRAGPFVTQSTAWQRWREARDRGLAVSNGVVPCVGDGIRGYCFFVFYRC